MLKPDIIAIGASAGGVEVLREVVAGFPPDLNAAVFVVVHNGNGLHGRSLLPELLSAAGPIPAVHPLDGDPIRKGRFMWPFRIITWSSRPVVCASCTVQKRT